MRQINESVWEMDGDYYVDVYGDKVLLKATNAEDATAEANEIFRQASEYATTITFASRLL